MGGSGGIGDGVHPGDVVISSGVVREEGMTKAYIPSAYPATAPTVNGASRQRS